MTIMKSTVAAQSSERRKQRETRKKKQEKNDLIASHAPNIVDDEKKKYSSGLPSSRSDNGSEESEDSGAPGAIRVAGLMHRDDDEGSGGGGGSSSDIEQGAGGGEDKSDRQSAVLVAAELAVDPDEAVAAALKQEEVKRELAIAQALQEERDKQKANIIQASVVQANNDGPPHITVCGVSCCRPLYCYLSLLILLIVMVSAIVLVVVMSTASPEKDGGTTGNNSPGIPFSTPEPLVPTEPPTAAPLEWVQVGPNLQGSVAGAFFGIYVTLSDAGNRLAISSDGEQETPAVRFYEIGDDGSTISLYSAEDEEDYFPIINEKPIYATVSGDGRTFVVIANYMYNETTFDATACQIQFFDRLEILRQNRPTLYVDGEFNAWNQRNLAISSDVSIIAVATRVLGEFSFEYSIRIYTYESNNDTWQQVGDDIIHSASIDMLQISSDGSILAVLSGDRFPLSSVLMYSVGSDGWNEIDAPQVLLSSGAFRMVLSSDGKRVAVDPGIVYELRDDQGWYQVGDTIEADDPQGCDPDAADDDSIGCRGYNLARVALSGDGKTLATSTHNADSADIEYQIVGYTRVFRENNGMWEPLGQRIDGASYWESFGSSISLNYDGTRLAVSAPGNEEFDGAIGLVRIYNLQ